jgi:CBS domain-containing protein
VSQLRDQVLDFMDYTVNVSSAYSRCCCDLMRKRLITIEESASVQGAAKKMMDKNISSLVVVDENGRPMGLATERDLVRKVCIHDAYTSKIITKEIMSSPLITIESRSSLSEAIDTMLRNNVRHLLVVDNSNRSPEDNNKPIGIITPLDFTRSHDYAGSDNNDNIEKLLEYYI